MRSLHLVRTPKGPQELGGLRACQPTSRAIPFFCTPHRLVAGGESEETAPNRRKNCALALAAELALGCVSIARKHSWRLTASL